MSIVDTAEQVMEIVVEDNQLSLAIGKKGRTSAWHPSSSAGASTSRARKKSAREIEAQFEGVMPETSESDEQPPAEEPAAEAVSGTEDAAPAFSIAGVGDKTIKKLIAAGFDTAEKIALASVDALSEVQGIGAKTAERILAAARGESPAAEEEKL